MEATSNFGKRDICRNFLSDDVISPLPKLAQTIIATAAPDRNYPALNDRQSPSLVAPLKSVYIVRQVFGLTCATGAKGECRICLQLKSIASVEVLHNLGGQAEGQFWNFLAV